MPLQKVDYSVGACVFVYLSFQKFFSCNSDSRALLDKPDSLVCHQFPEDIRCSEEI